MTYSWIACLVTIAVVTAQKTPRPHTAESARWLRINSSPVVSTSKGDVRGVKVKLKGENCSAVNQFLGIPYAQPPIANRRWKKPKPPIPWSNILNTTKLKAICPQALSTSLPSALLPVWHQPNSAYVRSFLMSEDCLYLNIYVPGTCGDDNLQEQRLAVMVYFHGHTFSEGSGNFYDGSLLANHGGVIVVTFNYRLGVFGFLSTLDNNLPGNYGLWDQIKALEWVNKNIKNFGGDPLRITVFGSGSGAASIGLLMLSAKSEGIDGNGTKGYFKRAILQSGSALAPWSIVKDPRKQAKTLWNHSNISCYADTYQSSVECLRSKSWNDLISVNIKVEKYDLAFGPVVDGKDGIITHVPDTLIENGEFIDYTVMLGVAQGDGFGYVRNRLKACTNQNNLGFNYFSCSSTPLYEQSHFSVDIVDFVSSFYHVVTKRKPVQDIIQFAYTDWTNVNDPITMKKSLMDIYTDKQWVEPAVTKANVQVKFSHSTFFYTFNHHPGNEQGRDWIAAAHGEELPFIFGAPLKVKVFPIFPYNFTEDDVMVSLAVMTYWTNFAKNSDPMIGKKQTTTFDTKISNTFDSIKWVSYNSRNKSYLHISTKPRILHHYRAEKMALWKTFLPKIAGIGDKNSISTTASNQPSLYRNPSRKVTEWTPLPGSTKNIKPVSDPKKDQSREGGALSPQLSIIVIIGCVVLLINIIAFAVISYHKEKDKYKIEKLRSELRFYKNQNRKEAEGTIPATAKECEPQLLLEFDDPEEQKYHRDVAVYNRPDLQKTISSTVYEDKSIGYTTPADKSISVPLEACYPQRNTFFETSEVLPSNLIKIQTPSSSISPNPTKFDGQTPFEMKSHQSVIDLKAVQMKSKNDLINCSGLESNTNSLSRSKRGDDNSNGINESQSMQSKMFNNISSRCQTTISTPINYGRHFSLSQCNINQRQNNRCRSVLAITSLPENEEFTNLTPTYSLPRNTPKQYSEISQHYQTTPRVNYNYTVDSLQHQSAEIPSRNSNFYNTKKTSILDPAILTHPAPSPPQEFQDETKKDKNYDVIFPVTIATCSSVTTKL